MWLRRSSVCLFDSLYSFKCNAYSQSIHTPHSCQIETHNLLIRRVDKWWILSIQAGPNITTQNSQLIEQNDNNKMCFVFVTIQLLHMHSHGYYYVVSVLYFVWNDMGRKMLYGRIVFLLRCSAFLCICMSSSQSPCYYIYVYVFSVPSMNSFWFRCIRVPLYYSQTKKKPDSTKRFHRYITFSHATSVCIIFLKHWRVLYMIELQCIYILLHCEIFLR